ncbi:3,4-dihydroxy-2-butanone-4-phosphate synthase [Sediminivirga luteola]|jgi:3,4-dihydroxy 2-butanone 4-phosphate synthase/GTP cyclohydrolase II|uniref:3,4-dihydroxy-2-butanone 4-phosphate synthase n=1 Tax=Sediminivirga luteola TaxID=1774748 RepID=A0A8J2XJT0_9MICO|nr:3,4-dihydroxy-2-butanone-4-phosphate synthase [Sediminivirga luteola]GGA22216.1 hypothetical protein GCM10011333_26590 [Sediminivirga luteola]
MSFSTVHQAVAQIARGGLVVVVDDEDRENEGDLIMAAQTATAESLGFMIRYSSGVVCAPLPRNHAERLELPPMVAQNQDPRGTAYTLSCDAREGVSTGISAADRARTVNLLADPLTTADDLVRPGHIFPLIARDGGVLERPGHTEAAVDLARLAGLQPAGVIAELVHDDGSMMRLPALEEFAAEHDLPLISIEQLAGHLQTIADTASSTTPGTDASPPPVHLDSGGADTIAPAPRPATTAASDGAMRPGAEPTLAPATASAADPDASLPALPPTVSLPTAHGDFHARAWRIGAHEYLSLSREARDAAADALPLVRVHSECLTGDVFGSYRCDCGEQLHEALARIAGEGGTLIYMAAHEGRGIGLVNKLAAYRLQEEGYDTVDANLRLGLPEDSRSYEAAAVILRTLGQTRIRLLSNNPAKERALRGLGIEVAATEQLEVPARPDNARYLTTKRDRMHHQLSGLA